jgi:pSer/pThr/pTyr-binding forkhead associated (FHA) protein
MADTEHASVRVLNGKDRGKRWALQPDQQYRVGRSSSCAIRLVDPTVSAVHASIECLDDTWFLTDLDSTHGTRVNRQRILTMKPLFDRDRAWIGKTLLEFRQYEMPTEEELRDLRRGITQVGSQHPTT